MLCSRKHLALANWCVLADHSIDAVGDLLGLSPRCVRVIQDFTFQPQHWIFKNFDTRYRSFCVLNIAVGSAPIAPQASRKACSFLPVNSFIMFLLGVRMPFRSFLLIQTLSRPFGRFDSRDFDRRDLTLGHLKQLSGEPRRIEILGQSSIPHFQSEVAYYRRHFDPLFSSGRTGQISEDFCHPHGRSER